jgi:hypothetical protein
LPLSGARVGGQLNNLQDRAKALVVAPLSRLLLFTDFKISERTHRIDIDRRHCDFDQVRN